MRLKNTKVCCVTSPEFLSLTRSSSAEDEAAAARIAAKNGLESYAYNLRNSINDEKLAGKFDPADKTKLETAVNETISWLDQSQEGSKEEYDDKQKELEGIAKYVLNFIAMVIYLLRLIFLSPIMQKLYGGAGGAGGGFPGGAGGFPGGGFPGGGAPGGFPGAGGEEGPSVEEVD
jgi:L1 cell adhesion molecule like protein